MKLTCACIRGLYNFHLQSLDKNNLIYQDMSDWMDSDDSPRYMFPNNYEVTIFSPESKTGKTLNLSVTNTNRISNKNLGSITDGIWRFETESCGNLYSKSVGIYYAIECCIRKALATADDQKYAKIKEAEKFVEQSKISVELNNPKEAEDYLKMAKKMLDRIKCNC